MPENDDLRAAHQREQHEAEDREKRAWEAQIGTQEAQRTATEALSVRTFRQAQLFHTIQVGVVLALGGGVGVFVRWITTGSL